jgi:5-methylcytosine-specific restriction protein A
MALAAPHPCNHPGCAALVPMGTPNCPVHTRARHREDRARRGSSTERGYDARWRAYRLRYLAQHPLCVQCAAEPKPRITPSTVVDHIKAHKGDPKLFWDPTNHRAVCKPHHDERVDEGDFGRPPVEGRSTP